MREGLDTALLVSGSTPESRRRAASFAQALRESGLDVEQASPGTALRRRKRSACVVTIGPGIGAHLALSLIHI